MDMPAITDSLRAKVGDASGLNATLKFDCGDDGVAYIDGRSTPNTVDNTDRDAETPPLPDGEAMDPFMRAAIEEAEAGMAEGGIPIGSVVVHEGKIVGRGHNRQRS